MMNDIITRYSDRVEGTLSCPDRVVIGGTLPGVCYAEGMAGILRGRGIRIFDYAKRIAEPLRDRIRRNAEQLAAAAGIEIEHIRKRHIRKEQQVRRVLDRRGDHPGLVHILSAMETCNAYKPWHDKKTGRTFLKPDTGKCLHYYFYFIDERLGLCHLRVPTWCPFMLQFYFNGHNALARELDRKGIGYTMADNAFIEIDDWNKAQKMADRFSVKTLHRTLDRYAARFCPVLKDFEVRYHWSLKQVEYASDIVFKRIEDLTPLYESISQTAIHAVKADNVATFLGHKLHGNFQGELSGDYSTRIQGTRIKHSMAGKATIKMYDKVGRVLRIETTVNDVSFFKHYRKVEHRDGSTSMKVTSMKKNIYSLDALTEQMTASNKRYLAFISQLEDSSPGLKAVAKIAESVRDQGRSQRGFNPLRKEDHRLLLAIARGEFNISGLTNKAMRRILPHYSGSQMSRLLKRLRAHGLIKKIGHTYKYYLTKLGSATVTTALKLRELVVIPTLAQPTC